MLFETQYLHFLCHHWFQKVVQILSKYHYIFLLQKSGQFLGLLWQKSMVFENRLQFLLS